jgi:hypothetical protein
MARTSARMPPDRERVLRPASQRCLVCGSLMHIRYENRRTLVTLTGSVRLRLKIGAVGSDVGIDCGAFSGGVKVSAQAARSMG